jgi:hypothetical protein
MTEETASGAEREDYELVEQRVSDHPGYQEHMLLESLDRTFRGVFLGNWYELLGLLDAAATNLDLAVELIQNAYKPDVRDQFANLIAQRLHNYVAATMTLVEHTRRIMRDREGPIADELAVRKQALLANREIAFLQDLRNYVLHYELPFFGHSLSLTGNSASEPHMSSEVELGVAGLSRWSGWSPTSRAFLEEQGDTVVLRTVIRRHGELVATFNAWLYNALAEANAPALAEANLLVAERNAVLLGIKQDVAQRWTAELTERRDTPKDQQTVTLKDLLTRGFRDDELSGGQS